MTIQSSNPAASKMNLQNGDAAALLGTLSAGHVTVVARPTAMSAEKESSTRRPTNASGIGRAAMIRSDVDGGSDVSSTGSLLLRRSAPISADRSQTSALLRPHASGSESRKLPSPAAAAAAAGPVPVAKTPNMHRLPPGAGDDHNGQILQRSRGENLCIAGGGGCGAGAGGAGVAGAGGGADGGTVDGKAQRPRASVERRNRRERLRVKQINNTFVTLRNQLPSACWSPKQRSAKKFSKVDTLRLAIEYIRNLQQQIRDHDAMYMSAECLALLSSPADRVGCGDGSGFDCPSSYPTSSSSSSFSSAVFLDSASDRSGAESVSSSVPDQQSSGNSLLMDFLTGLGRPGGSVDADDLYDDAFFLDDCNYFVS